MLFRSTGWMEDQEYRQVPDRENYIKSYLQGGRMTKDTNRYLVMKIILSPTYGMDK